MKQISLRKSALALSVAVLIAGPQAAQACSDTPYMGTLCTFAATYCPQGYLPADGRTLNISQYSALYSLLGIYYGGDGRTTFALPDLRGRVVVGAGAGTGLTPINIGVKDGQEKVALNANNMAPHVHPGTVSGTVSGTASLPVTATVSGQTVTGNVTVSALNGSNPPTGGAALPDSSHNTVGKGGPAIFFPAGSSQVAVPTSHNLAISGGTVSGTASGSLSNLAISGGTVVVGNNTTANTPVPTIPPRQALNVCIAVEGLYPVRP